MSRRVKITITNLDGSMIEKSVKSALVHLDELLKYSELDEKFELEIIEMSDNDFAKLPEFEGW